MHQTQTMRFTTDEQATIFLEGLKAGRVPADTMVNIDLDLLSRHRKEFQARGPKLRFRVFWPADRYFANISARPQYAPANYRTMPPWNVKMRSSSGYGSDDITCGSGVLQGEVAGLLWLFCSVCGSRETKCIYFAHTELFLGSECEFVRGTRSEYECMQCGSFTTL